MNPFIISTFEMLVQSALQIHIGTGLIALKVVVIRSSFPSPSYCSFCRRRPCFLKALLYYLPIFLGIYWPIFGSQLIQSKYDSQPGWIQMNC